MSAFADAAFLCLITQWSLVGTDTHESHTLGGKNNHYVSKLCRILPLDCNMTVFTRREGKCLISVPLYQKQEAVIFFQYIVQQFQDKSVNICVQRFCTSFIFYSYSQAGLTDLMLCSVEELGLKWYEFLLCSCPSLTHSWGCFQLRRAEEPWHSQEQKPRQRTDISVGESHINLPSWGRAHAGIANRAPGCSDGSHRAG